MLWYNTTILRSKDLRIKFPSARTNLQEPVRYYTHSAPLLFSTFTRAEPTADYYRRKYFHDLIRFGKFKTSVARELRKITHRHKRVACFRTKFVSKRYEIALQRIILFQSTYLVIDQLFHKRDEHVLCNTGRHKTTFFAFVCLMNIRKRNYCYLSFYSYLKTSIDRK